MNKFFLWCQLNVDLILNYLILAAVISSSDSSSEGPVPSMERVSSSSVATSSSVEVVLDLYILKKKTDFYDQIIVAWIDTKIVSVRIE